MTPNEQATIVALVIIGYFCVVMPMWERITAGFDRHEAELKRQRAAKQVRQRIGDQSGILMEAEDAR